MNTTASLDDVIKVINSEHYDPFRVLGPHRVEREDKGKIFVVRAYYPKAKEVFLLDCAEKHRYKMEKVHDSGFFEVIVPDKEDFFAYMLAVTDETGHTFTTHDPYSFRRVITDFDLHLFNEGNHHKIYEKLGAHPCRLEGVDGTLFCVWAPCAKRVSVVGDFNQWDGKRHQMRSIGCSGVWEIFLPGVGAGDTYKYEIKTRDNELYWKADPYAFYSELRPGTASIVYDIEGYKWHDLNWIKERDEGNSFAKPVSIYEVHLGSWARVMEEDQRFLTYRELADKLVGYVKEMGYTHIELLPIAEHPFDGSWGYQTTGYYSVTSRYGKPEDFMYLVDVCHQNGIGVIMDWVPAHFPKDAHGLARFDGTALYEHYDPRQGEHPDWGTLIFNYGRHEVRNFLVANAVFWFEKYHIDGLRVDAVASMLYLDYGKKDGEWLPNRWGGKENLDAIQFLRQLNSTVYSYFPGIMMIAEESTSWALVSRPPYVGGLGFSYKWNMGWMNDFIRYISMDPIYRKYHHNNLTFSIMYAFSENFILVLSHDEVVHGKCSMINKMPGDYWQKFAGLRVSYAYMYGHPGKKLLFMGNEFGQFIEWDYKRSLDWHLLDYEMHRKLQNYVKDLNRMYKKEKALYEVDFSYEGFEWIDCSDSDHSVVSFIRRGKDPQDLLIFVCNFTPVVYYDYRIGVPFHVFYEEVLNSDSQIYGGSNVGNFGGVQAEDCGFHGKPYSIRLQIPPLAALVLKPRLEEEDSLRNRILLRDTSA
ncbi:MAG: 1,4-alpha-glucan branching protein GlgB [Clostridiales bacterium]|jgi:1,4-alpha-glucan branching enzyme|nr:1,4-alpha-glucan branching protein GlgB [Eubacteriales bacterium]MDH7566263.1 1,4-alpha-glucan branching protein GlgB [Clostridiales bacterium]